MPKPVIGITMGDPAGIGPEIVAKALANKSIQSVCTPVVFGSARYLGATVAAKLVEVRTAAKIPVGRKSVEAGEAALSYLIAAVKAALARDIAALVTAPVSKAAIHMAGYADFTGHTEYLANVAQTRSFAMMFHSKRLKVSLVTTHLPLRSVARAITTQRVLDVIRLSNQAMQKLGVAAPRIGVAGLNPHAGEDGAFGDEDSRVIAPAVENARASGIEALGPLPADTLFHAAYNRKFHLVVGMYHDQALAPFKMVAFEKGVNVTLGLPFVRTSVDHGTAFDIAGKGLASETSLVEAIKLAVRLTR
jgi:4-hydroxythreonine-4-phosphate dehydrogenase